MTKKESIEAKILELKARLTNEQNKEREQERKKEARLKIVLGAKLMGDSSQTALVKKYKAEFEAEEKARAEKKAKAKK